MISKQYIDYFSGSKTIELGVVGSYVDVRGLVNGVYESLVDSNVFELNYLITDAGNDVYLTLYSHNFTPSNFPLEVVTFTTDDDFSNYKELFHQLQASPLTGNIFAIGKRNKVCKNVLYSDIASYCTDGGGMYVKRSNNLSDVLPAVSRDNLGVYSKGYIDSYSKDYVSSANNFRRSSSVSGGQNCVYCEAVTGESYGDYSPCTINRTVSYTNGLIGLHYGFSNVGCIKLVNYSVNYNLGSLSSITGMSVSVQYPIIVIPTVLNDSLTSIPITSNFSHYAIVEGEQVLVVDATVYENSLDVFPEMVVTGGDALVYRGMTLSPNTVYLCTPYAMSASGSALSTFVSLPTNYTFSYDISFIANDAQLN